MIQAYGTSTASSPCETMMKIKRHNNNKKNKKKTAKFGILFAVQDSSLPSSSSQIHSNFSHTKILLNPSQLAKRPHHTSATWWASSSPTITARVPWVHQCMPSFMFYRSLFKIRLDLGLKYVPSRLKQLLPKRRLNIISHHSPLFTSNYPLRASYLGLYRQTQSPHFQQVTDNIP